MKSKRHSINKNETLWRVRELKSDNDTKLFSKKEDAVEFARKRVIEIEKKCILIWLLLYNP